MLTYRSCILVALLLLAALAGCDSEPAAKLSVPVDGVWDVGRGLGLKTFYVIDLNEGQGTGTLAVEVSGQEIRRHEFEVISPDSIEIVGAEGESFSEPSFEPEIIADVIRLAKPPKYLFFDSMPPPQFAGKAPSGQLYVGGIIAIATLPMIPVPDTFRMNLPVDYTADVNLELPEYKISFGGDDGGAWGSGMSFAEPVTPTGSIRSVSIDGREVALADTTVHDGLLTTRDFGDLRVSVTGAYGGMELHATRAQIKQIIRWLDRAAK